MCLCLENTCAVRNQLRILVKIFSGEKWHRKIVKKEIFSLLRNSHAFSDVEDQHRELGGTLAVSQFWKHAFAWCHHLLLQINTHSQQTMYTCRISFFCQTFCWVIPPDLVMANTYTCTSHFFVAHVRLAECIITHTQTHLQIAFGSSRAFARLNAHIHCRVHAHAHSQTHKPASTYAKNVRGGIKPVGW